MTLAVIETRYETHQPGRSRHADGGGTTLKVVELVLEQMAYGWSPEELHFQHPYLTLGQIYSALLIIGITKQHWMAR